MNSARSAEEKEDTFSLVIFLLGSVGYEKEADTLARLSTCILKNWQVVEGISRFQFPTTGRTRLMYAAKTGNLKRLNFIADLGARVNMTAQGQWDEKWTALHFASQRGHTKCVRVLLDRGAMIDAQDGDGWTALHFASQTGHLDIVRLFCERDAQIDLQTTSGGTALLWAALNNKIGIAHYLCERGANTLLSCYGKTPYAHACKWHGANSPIALLLKSYPH